MEYNVRLYDSTGKRLALDSSWITGLNFEIGENGGFQNGSITLQTAWENLSLAGTEYVDIRCFDSTTVTYRGFVMKPEKRLEEPETWDIGLVGLMERLNGYIVQKCYCYSAFTDIGTVFTDIVSDYVTSTGRLTGLVVDTTGVSALSIKLTEFCAKGNTVSQAFNKLCETAPQTLLWGCDVDSSGSNRLYLYPRPTSVQDTYIVGKDVAALLYPSDVTQVANRVYVTGGTASLPNLAPNASFETCTTLSDDSSNLLTNGGWEEGWNYWTGYSAGLVFSFPTNTPNYSHTGNGWALLYNNFTYIYQDVSIGFPQPFTMSVWAMQRTAGGNQQLQFVALELDSGGAVLNTWTSTAFTPTDSYAQYTYSVTPTNAACTQIRFKLQGASVVADAFHGCWIDDAMMLLSNLQASSWGVGTNSNAIFSGLDWQSRDRAKDGIISVKATPNILSAGGYVEIAVRTNALIDVQPGKTYYFTAWFWGSAGTVKMGIQEYSDSTLSLTNVDTYARSVTTFGTWQRQDYSITVGVNTNKIRPFVRVFDTSGNPVYIDAVMVTQGASVSVSEFYAGSTYDVVRSVTDYSSGDIGADAAASISTYGVREKAETVDVITGLTLAETFVKDFFRANAVPKVEGKLSVKGAVKNINLSGTLRIVNLPSAPPAALPSRVRYRIGDSFDIEVDLNNQRPDMATLLRKVAQQTAAQVATKAVAGATTGGGGGGGSYPSGGGVTSLNGATGATRVLSGTGMSSVVSGGDTTLNVVTDWTAIICGG